MDKMEKDKILQRLDRIDKKLNELLKDSRQPKPLWVTAPMITECTGWDSGKMKTARQEGWIEFKKINNGDGTYSLRYNVNSLNSFFLLKDKPSKKIDNRF